MLSLRPPWVLVVSCVAAGVLFVAPVSSQERAPGLVRCDLGRDGTGIIRGRLYAAQDEVSLGRFVGIRREGEQNGCSIPAADDGTFEFRNVPPGSYSLGVASLNLGEMSRIPVEMQGQGEIRIAVPLYRENRLLECLRNPVCAPVLTRQTAAELGAPDEEQLRLLGYRLGVVLAGEDWGDGSEWVACVRDYEEFAESLREVFANVAPSSECQFRETHIEGLTNPIQALQHIESGKGARSIRVDLADVGESEATLRIAYTVGRLWGEGHLCTAVKIDGDWLPRACRMRVIS